LNGIFARLLAFALAMTFLVAADLCCAQSRPPGAESQAKPSNYDETRARMEKEMAKKANQQRQAELKRDSDKLLQLATELKTYVDRTNENLLSLEVVTKAEQIEKLAHSVREKMRGNN